MADFLAKAEGPPARTSPPQEPVAGSMPARIPFSKRAQIDAMNTIAKQRGEVSEEKPISYYTPELIQCTLPHSERKTVIKNEETGEEQEIRASKWIRKNGDYSLIIVSGVNGKGDDLGIPYGAFPRLVLAYIITQVMAKPDRKIELASHFGGFLKEIGYTGNLRGNTAAVRHIKDQLQRLLGARITFEYEEGTETRGRVSRRNIDIAPNYDLWWDYKNPHQDSLFGSRLEISEAFYNAILDNPVPLRTDVLKALRNSPMAIDAYMWLSYRLFTMQTGEKREIFIPYGALQNQFGTGIAEKNYRQFRSELKKAFAKVAALWHHGGEALPITDENWKGERSVDGSLLSYEFTEKGLFLHRSPLLVGRGDRLTDQEKIQAILSSRKFDSDTLRKVRRFAGKWDIERLQSDYFQWLDEKRIVPTAPVAHFIDFVKSHVKRNP